MTIFAYDVMINKKRVWYVQVNFRVYKKKYLSIKSGLSVNALIHILFTNSVINN